MWETPVIRTSRSATDRIKVTFSLPLHQASGRCSVVGDFNEWIPGSHELRKRTNGTRSASVVVPRGTRLRFRYLGEDGTWFNDPDAPHREGADDVVVV
jgi:1,4-alpha-glucan branching enzyme